MSLLQRLLSRLGFPYRGHVRRDPAFRYYELGGNLHLTLKDLAEQEGRTEEDLTADLLARGLSEYYSSDELWQKWEALSPREQEVAALTCLGFTNRQIASQLGISADTVKTHLRNVLAKFQLHSKSELRLAFAGWDFSAWMEHG
jgi:DNA-binding CsgD family transcriptional regulator